MKASSFYDEEIDVFIISATGKIKRPEDSTKLQVIAFNTHNELGFTKYSI